MKTAHLASTLLIVVLLASCSGGSAGPTPTPVDVNALQTAAVQTVVADITQSAATQPLETVLPTETETETPVPVPTETPTPAASSTPSTCDNSAFISDASVPDGTVMTAGQEFIKTWKVKNTGTCNWTTGYRIIFSYGVQMGGLPTALTAEIASNAEAEIAVKLKAPLKSGNYSGYWRLANNNGYAFGEIFTVVITAP
jgi:hypothetical protein